MGGYALDYSSYFDPNSDGMSMSIDPATGQPYATTPTPTGGPAQRPAMTFADNAPSGYTTPGYNNDFAANGINWGTSNPADALRQNRTLAYNSGTQQLQRADAEQSYQDQLQNYYGGVMNSGYAQLNDTPGYTAQEQGSMDQAANSMGPTAAETAAMNGNTDYTKYFDQSNGQSQDTLNTEQSGINSALGDESSNVRGYVDPSKLSLNLNPQDYLMSDTEKQGLINQAAQSAHLARQSDQEQNTRNALAGGNADYKALAAANNRSEKSGNVEAANAMTNASLAASQNQRDLAMNYAGANLSANQGYANMGVNAETNLGQQKVAAAQSMGQQGLNAAQYTGSLGTNILQSQDQAAASRAAQQYGIQNANTQYGIGLTQNEAAARQNGQQQFRNWATGQTNAATQSSQGWGQQGNQAQSNMTSGVNTAGGQWAQYDVGKGTQGFANNFGNAAGSAFGKAVGSGFGFL